MGHRAGRWAPHLGRTVPWNRHSGISATAPLLCLLTASLRSELADTVSTVSLPIHSPAHYHEAPVLTPHSQGRPPSSCSKHVAPSYSILNLLAAFDRADRSLLESLKSKSFSGSFFSIEFISSQSYFVSLHTRLIVSSFRSRTVSFAALSTGPRLVPGTTAPGMRN